MSAAELLTLLREDADLRTELAALLLPEFELNMKVEGYRGYESDNRNLQLRLSAGKSEISDQIYVTDLH